MLENIFSETTNGMDKSIEALKKDFTTLRGTRVSVQILDGIKVNYYNTPTPLNQISQVLSSDATTLVVTPWEKNILKDIEKAILEANIGVNPNNDGECIKLFFPPMSKEQRQEIAKNVQKMAEKSKVSIRNIRQDANNQVKKLEKDKQISIDESKKAQENIQKYTDFYTKKVEELAKAKEDEVLKI
ncbi:MAG: ribosome recycling factor [Helicobacter sp.]|nr:ribosome recycling factor [Helicobacter sp.]